MRFDKTGKEIGEGVSRPRLSERALARLHFVQGKCRVMLHDVETGDVVEVGPREWVLLASADGTRDAEGIRLAASREGVHVTAEVLEELLAGARAAGMIAEGPPKKKKSEGAEGAREVGPASVSGGGGGELRAGPEKVPDARRPIERLAGYSFHCDGHGSCCQMYATVVFSPLEAARARSLRPDVLDGGERHEHVFMPERGAGPCAGSAVAIVDGRCAYLEGSLCALHKVGGAASKPIGCNLFPLALVDDGARVRASVSVECACVLASVGRPGGEPILAPELKARGDLDPAVVIDELPDEVEVTPGKTAPLAEYLAWSDAALGELDRALGDWQSGDRQSGDSESGDRQSGDSESGDRQSGDSESGERSSVDAARVAWALAEALERRGLDPEAAREAVRGAAGPDGALAGRFVAALGDKAAHRAKSQNAWRSEKDLCRRGVAVIGASATLLSDPELLAAVAAGAGAAPADEGFYLRVALFGHQMVGYPLSVSLRDRGVAMWIGRLFPLAAETLYPGEVVPAFRHPLALVEALLRGHGLRRYTDAVAGLTLAGDGASASVPGA